MPPATALLRERIRSTALFRGTPCHPPHAHENWPRFLHESDMHLLTSEGTSSNVERTLHDARWRKTPIGPSDANEQGIGIPPWQALCTATSGRSGQCLPSASPATPGAADANSQKDLETHRLIEILPDASLPAQAMGTESGPILRSATAHATRLSAFAASGRSPFNHYELSCSLLSGKF